MSASGFLLCGIGDRKSSGPPCYHRDLTTTQSRDLVKLSITPLRAALARKLRRWRILAGRRPSDERADDGAGRAPDDHRVLDVRSPSARHGVTGARTELLRVIPRCGPRGASNESA